MKWNQVQPNYKNEEKQKHTYRKTCKDDWITRNNIAKYSRILLQNSNFTTEKMKQIEIKKIDKMNGRWFKCWYTVL